MNFVNGIARGAASELIASAHLMELGYHVFRSLSASCPCDLIAYKGGELLRVEVKSASIMAGKTYNPSFPRPSNDEWDLLVVVSDDRRVVVLPRRESYEELKVLWFAELGIEPKIRVVKTHCARGHEFTPENTGRSYQGYRACLTCYPGFRRLDEKSTPLADERESA